MSEYTIISSETGTDSLGTPFASVCVTSADGNLYAQHSSFSRGGCLHAGFVMLRNFKTGTSKEIDITSYASDSEHHCRYLVGLAEKHLGGAR